MRARGAIYQPVPLVGRVGHSGGPLVAEGRSWGTARPGEGMPGGHEGRSRWAKVPAIRPRGLWGMLASLAGHPWRWRSWASCSWPGAGQVWGEVGMLAARGNARGWPRPLAADLLAGGMARPAGAS